MQLLSVARHLVRWPGMDNETTPAFAATHERAQPLGRAITLTIANHPDLRRIGQMACLDDRELAAGICRGTPHFGTAPGHGHPLDDRFISRTPTRFIRQGGDLDVRVRGRVHRNGRALQDSALLTAAELAQGVALTFGDRVTLFLREGPRVSWGKLEAVGGTSPEFRQVHEAVLRSSALDGAVLVCGPIGSRRAAVCRALHDRSARAEAPFVEAQTTEAPDACIARARSGTLVLLDLDETGLSPEWLSRIERTRDVRILATTAVPTTLPLALRSAFRDHIVLPHRLPVEDRFVHFGRALVSRLDAIDRTSLVYREPPWMGPDVTDALLERSWTGGWHEVATFAHRIAMESPDERAVLPAVPIESTLQAERDALYSLLAPHAFRISVAARSAGMSPNTLRRRMHAAGLPIASQLTAAQIDAAAERTHGDLEAMARELGVAVHGLRMRRAALET